MEALIALLKQFWVALQQGTLPELGAWNYVLLSVLIIIQGPAATLLGGAAAAAGLMRPFYVLLAGVIGNLVADVLWYSAGHAGKTSWILRYGRYFGIRQWHLDRLLHSMRRHSTKILLLAKISAGLAIPALLAAGLSRVRWRRWFPVVFVGETVWTGSLVLMGYFATGFIARVDQELRIVALVISVLLVFSVFWFVPRILRQGKLLDIPVKGEFGVTVEEQQVH